MDKGKSNSAAGSSSDQASAQTRDQKSPEQTLVIIDGKSVFYRGFYAMRGLTNADGLPTGGVYGFASMVFDALVKYRPQYMCVAWDKSKTNIRSRQEIYPEYKGNRTPAPTEFHQQIPALHKFVDAMGWPLYELDDYEADDIAGTLAKKASTKGIDTLIVTSDRDLLQLIDDRVKILILKKGLTNTLTYDRKQFEKDYSIKISEMDDYKALRGDPSDNIPGVKGIGEKTAINLVQEFSDLETIYKNIELISPAVAKKLAADEKMAYISRDLVRIMTDAPVDLNLDDLSTDKFDYQKVIDVLKELEFRSLLRQAPKVFNLSPDQAADSQVALGGARYIAPEPIDDIKIDLKKPVYLDCYVGSDRLQADRYYIGQGEKLYAKAMQPQQLKEILSGAKVFGHDVKKTLRTLGADDMDIEVVHDSLVAGFIIDSRTRQSTLSSLAQRYDLPWDESIDSWPLPEDESVAPKRFVVAEKVMKMQKGLLKEEPKLQDLLSDIDLAVDPILAQMEAKGMLIDKGKLAEYAAQLGDDILDLNQEVYGYAGREFNVGSPRQLAEVLFEDLQLPTKGIRRTKTGYSTAASELKKLSGQHEIIDRISTFRELSKLKNTYVDVLPELAAADGRIHTTFSLVTAQTGRLSSHDPNLQNIPVRTEHGRRIRSSFVATKGNKIIQADYSQFELRLAASLSGDSEMVKVFNEGQDIHRRTASEIFDVPIDEVTKQQRYMAKAVNFGVLYGQGPHGLAEGAGVSYEEATGFIGKFYELRPNLRQYFDELVTFAASNGYVENLFGRRRYVDDINSKNFMLREAAKRAIINMPIQGTAADIAKVAMIKVGKALPKGANMLMQVHDSIMIECPEAAAEDIAKQTQQIMQNAYDVGVKIDVDVDIADNWGEL